MPSSEPVSASARSPGVSMSTPPPGSGISSRATVVWRPRPSLTRTSRVACRSSPSSALTSVDLPAPDGPMQDGGALARRRTREQRVDAPRRPARS